MTIFGESAGGWSVSHQLVISTLSNLVVLCIGMFQLHSLNIGSADVLSGRHFVRTALDVLSGRRFVRTSLDVLSGRHFVRTVLDILSLRRFVRTRLDVLPGMRFVRTALCGIFSGGPA